MKALMTAQVHHKPASKSVTDQTVGALRYNVTRFSLCSAFLLCMTLMTLSIGHNAHAAEKLKVVTSFTILADMAGNVAGDAADVVSITKPGAEIHNYQPTPKDIGRTRDADLILWNGLNLELWFEKFLTRLGDIPSAVLSDGVEPMSIGSGPYDGLPNPHVWMSPNDALVYVDNIEKALSAADPDNTSVYQANAADYKARIKAITEPLREQLASIAENQRWLVTSEGAFSYLARDFDLKELYLWPINADSQGTPQQVRHVIDTVRDNDIPVVFSESTVSAKPAQQVARETDTHYGGILYVDSLSDQDGPVPTYLDLLKVTIDTIVTGILTGSKTQ
ncbi:MAG: metal ABC transporter substrate-binding protein [Granulosicoccus sp.]